MSGLGDRDRPLVVTSLAPQLRRQLGENDVGAAYQRHCVASWITAGANVVSVNLPQEVDALREIFPEVRFNICETTGAVPGVRSLPAIRRLLSVGQEEAGSECFAVVNSDIEFLGDAAMLRDLFRLARGRVVYANRCERRSPRGHVELPYLYGYDFFLFDSSVVRPDDVASFKIGEPWWDYVLLFRMAARGVPLAYVATPVVSHLTHTQVWSATAWRSGLEVVARSLQVEACSEGPVASLLSFMCRSLSPGALPSYAMNGIIEPFGTALGLAMVNFIRESCGETIWFEEEITATGLRPCGAPQVARLISPSAQVFS